MNHKIVYDCPKNYDKKAVQHVAAFLLLNGAFKTINRDTNAKHVGFYISGEMTM